MKDILIFNIDCGTMPPQKSKEYVERVKEQALKTNAHLTKAQCLFFPRNAGGTGVTVKEIPLRDTYLYVFQVDIGQLPASRANDKLTVIREQVFEETDLEPESCLFFSSSDGRTSDVTLISGLEPDYLVQTLGNN